MNSCAGRPAGLDPRHDEPMGEGEHDDDFRQRVDDAETCWFG
jgi:hypothetical protein